MSEETTTVNETTTPTSTPSPTPTATPSPTATETPKPGVYLAPERYEEMLSKINVLDQRLAAEAEKAREANERALQRQIESGKVTEALEGIKKSRDEDVQRARLDAEQKAATERQQWEQRHRQAEEARLAAENRAKQIESRAKKHAVDKALADALNAHSEILTPGSSEFLSQLWANQFVADEQGDSYVARTTDGKTVAEFVNATIGSDKYATFRRAATKGGGTQLSGASTTASPSPTPAAPPPEFKNAGEQLMAWARENQKQYNSSNADMSKPMGLKIAR